MITNPFETFEQINSKEALAQFAEDIKAKGFTGFRIFLEGFSEKLKSFEEQDTDRLLELLGMAKDAFPVPASFSPTWQVVWDEYETIITTKAKVLKQVPPEQREGEWQIIIDNPFTNQDIVCYPGMPFVHAAYMFGYFRVDLKKNEFLRLQKIVDCITEFGGADNVEA